MLKIAAILILFVALALVGGNFLPGWQTTHFFTDPANAQTAPVSAEPLGFIASVDTMKESLDTLNNRLTQAQINNTVNLSATLNTNYIAISVPYDNPDYAAMWVNAIRSKGKKVWFRMSWNNWLGIYNQPGTMTPSEFLSKTRNYILTNRNLFKPGDIFDITPEAEQGKYWAAKYNDSWNWLPQPPNDATREYNAFIRDGSSAAQQAFEEIGVKNVTTNIRSLNPYQIMHVLEPETVAALGRLTVDGYPDQGITDPAEAAQKRVTELQNIYDKWKVPVILGEMGYDNHNPHVTDLQQQTVLKAEFDAIMKLPFVQGLNYWVGPGYPAPDQYNGTRIFNGTRGAWTLRPAGNDLKNYFGRNIYRPVIANISLPSSVKNGDRLDFSAQAAVGSSVSGVVVKFSILNSSGGSIFTNTQTPVGFTANIPRTLTASWPVPQGQSAGSYTLKVEITVNGQPVSTDSKVFEVK